MLDIFVDLFADKNRQVKQKNGPCCLLNSLTERHDVISGMHWSHPLQVWQCSHVTYQCYHSQKVRQNAWNQHQFEDTWKTPAKCTVQQHRGRLTSTTLSRQNSFNASKWLKQETQHITTGRAHNIAKVCRRQTRIPLNFKLDFNSDRSAAWQHGRCDATRYNVIKRKKRSKGLRAQGRRWTQAQS